MRLVVTCHLQTCYNLFQQLAASFVATSFDSQPATSLTTTCNRRVVDKLSQGTLRFTERQRDGNVLRQRVN